MLLHLLPHIARQKIIIIPLNQSKTDLLPKVNLGPVVGSWLCDDADDNSSNNSTAFMPSSIFSTAKSGLGNSQNFIILMHYILLYWGHGKWILYTLLFSNHCLSLCYVASETKTFCVIYHNQGPFLVAVANNAICQALFQFFSPILFLWIWVYLSDLCEFKQIKEKHWNTRSYLSDFYKATASYDVCIIERAEIAGNLSMRGTKVTLKIQALKNVLWIHQEEKTEKDWTQGLLYS